MINATLPLCHKGERFQLDVLFAVVIIYYYMKSRIVFIISLAFLVGCGELAKLASGPIHLSVERQDVEAVRKYLDGGRDVDAKDIEGETPLHMATFVDNK